MLAPAITRDFLDSLTPTTIAALFSDSIMIMGINKHFLGQLRGNRAFLVAWWRVTLPYALPLWVGSLVVAAALGILAYVVTRWAVTAYRKRRPQLELPLSGTHR